MSRITVIFIIIAALNGLCSIIIAASSSHGLIFTKVPGGNDFACAETTKRIDNKKILKDKFISFNLVICS